MRTIAFFDAGRDTSGTTLVYHLASMYARLGVNVLAADLDPQANLTGMFLDDEEIEPIWADDGRRGTVYGALRPLLEGADDVAAPHVAEPDPGLGLVVGDPALAITEEELSRQWAACLDRQPRAFRVLSALARILQLGATEINARLTLMDVGPSLGAFNRAVLVVADVVVVPLAPDLRSLQGLDNLGQTLRRWQGEWAERRELSPVGVPGGAMRPIGYVVMQPAVRLDRPIDARRRGMSRIPALYRATVVGETSTSGDVTVSNDPNCLASLKPYGLLHPLAREARKPMFALKPADGAIGGHTTAVQDCHRDFRALAKTVAERAGSPLDEAEDWYDDSAGSSSPSQRSVDITFRPIGGPAPEPPPPDKILTPARMADLANALGKTIEKIQEWGIPVPVGSRLQETVALLEGIVPERPFPDSRECLPRIAHAACDAQEFTIIKGMLPRQPLPPMVESLARAVDGTIGGTPHQAYQAQSELWVGAALSCAGVPLNVLTNPRGPSPDYIVRNGTREYAIEVKRIASGRSLKRRVSKAATQTRDDRYHGSALYVDLTDWLPSAVTLRFAYGPPDLDDPRISIARRIDQLRREIVDDRTHRIRARRGHLFAVTAFARFIHWDLADLSQMHLTRYIAPLWFWHSVKDLRYHRARWLAELLQDGARNIGFQEIGAHEMRFQVDSG